MSEPRTDRPSLLRAEQVTKFYPDGNVSAVVDVDLEIHAGEYVSIMGPSGSGKSTLLNLLGALDVPTSGELYFEGEPVSQIRNLDRLRALKIGFVFQSFYLLPVLTAVENVQVPMFEGTLRVRERVAKAKHLLNIVGLGQRADHLPQQLSVGERQRVAIARALANDPLLLLADEPTGNLDSASAKGVFDLLAELHCERGMTIVLITHDDALGMRAKRLVRMQDGRVVSDRENTAAPSPSPAVAAPAASILRGPTRAKSVLPPFSTGRRRPLTPDSE
jgi:putative ABC transport system ATP-binding protein